MSLYNKFTSLIATDTALETAIYIAKHDRTNLIGGLVNGLRAKIQSDYPSKKAANFGLKFLADNLLLTEEATYLVISEGKQRRSSDTTLRMRVVILRRNSQDELHAYDATTNEDLGEAAPKTFHRSKRAADSQPGVYTDPNALRNLVLPLSGPVLTNPFGGRLALHAEAVVADVTTLNKIAALESIIAKLYAEQEANNQTASIAIDAIQNGDLIAVLKDQNAKLVKLLQTVDWACHDLDAYVSHGRRGARLNNKVENIDRLLFNLPIDDATALFVAHAGRNWPLLHQYTQSHTISHNVAAQKAAGSAEAAATEVRKPKKQYPLEITVASTDQKTGPNAGAYTVIKANYATRKGEAREDRAFVVFEPENSALNAALVAGATVFVMVHRGYSKGRLGSLVIESLADDATIAALKAPKIEKPKADKPTAEPKVHILTFSAIDERQKNKAYLYGKATAKSGAVETVMAFDEHIAPLKAVAKTGATVSVLAIRRNNKILNVIGLAA